jgi:hypothetical protein
MARKDVKESVLDTQVRVRVRVMGENRKEK